MHLDLRESKNFIILSEALMRSEVSKSLDFKSQENAMLRGRI